MKHIHLFLLLLLTGLPVVTHAQKNALVLIICHEGTKTPIPGVEILILDKFK